MRLRFVRVLPLVALSLAACTDPQHPSDVPGTDATDAVDRVTPMDIVQPDVPMVEDVQDVQPPEDVVEVDVEPEDVPVPMGPAFCTFPGSTVPGAVLPSGFCIREFVPHTGSVDGSIPGTTPDHISAPRNMSFAPNGDLFVASPAMGTAGGAGGGLGGIYVVTDSDHDGHGEIHVFNSGIADVHGLAVAPDAVYWTTEAGVWRTSYAAGQLAEDRPSRTLIGCFGGYAACGGACVQLSTDTGNCGACAHSCSAGETCASGTCVVETQSCAGTATNVLTDSRHCGSCGNACAAGQVCSLGVCAAGAGTVQVCGGHAVDTSTNTLFCGSCSRSCGPGGRCVNGSCASWRWTHGLMRSRAGRIYVTSGVWGASCPDPNVGDVHEVVDGAALRLVTRGFRNPMYGRCHYRDEVCAIDELGDDGGGSWGAAEKMLLLHDASNYGYPCCATTNRPAFGSTMSCADVTTEEAQMPLNDTPFGLDWERGYWDSPYRGGVFVAKHGSFYSSPSWHNVGIWWAPTNAATRAPSGAFTLLVDGFGTSTPQLRRPADVAFAGDGRLFFADDSGGGIYWVAPDSLRSP